MAAGTSDGDAPEEWEEPARVIARITRFYPGIGGWDAVLALPHGLRAALLKQIPVIQAEETMQAAQLADFPYLEKDARKRLIRLWESYLPKPEPKAGEGTSSPHVHTSLASFKAALAKHGLFL